MHQGDLEFDQGAHRFRIASNESCMIRTLTLSVRAASDNPNKPFWIEVYCVTEGDYVWNTLVADCAVDDRYDFAQAIDYLQDAARLFSAENPQELKFSSGKKAQQYSETHCKAPVNVRGFPYPVRYPGS